MKYAITVCTLCLVLVVASGAVWQTPTNLGSVVNSSADDSHPTIAADGSFIIFESTRTGGQGQRDLWITDYNGSAFTPPSNLGANVNTVADDISPFLAPDGSKLYWSTNNGSGSFGGYDIWYCPMIGGDPGVRVNLGAGINTIYNEISPVVSADGNTMYFATDRLGTIGSFDIYISVQSGGSWQTPSNLGAVINSTSSEEPVWISADGNTLLFYSNRPGGSYGGFDLWYSVKTGGTWGIPINMGQPINTPSDEHGATFRCNAGAIGGFMYFGSNRPGGSGGRDLWMSTETGYLVVEPASLGSIKANFH